MVKGHFDQIRQLLKEVEERMPSGSSSDGVADFSAAELPLIIREIVDDLQPLLSPYEVAFYWYAFRHSIARNGNPHVRCLFQTRSKLVANTERNEVRPSQRRKFPSEK